MPMSSMTYATMPAAGYGAPVTYMTQPQPMMYAAPPVMQAPPAQYVNENGQPCDEHGQPLQYVNEFGQPCDANGQPLQYVNENGQPCDENGQPLQYVNEHGQPCDANGNLIMQPGASMSYAAPAASMPYMGQHAAGAGGVFNCPPEIFMKMSQGQQLTPAEMDMVMGRAPPAPVASMAAASMISYPNPVVSMPAPAAPAPAPVPAVAPAVTSAPAKKSASKKNSSKKAIASKKSKKGCC
mmetsp:Transcript_103175/g.277205  ORF Transcript_103175/g.277205 Transcript_103175/m.277205 type:complete len:239 (+) Transcript_103175:2-718(+)